jgi:hypothetical protein
MTLSYNCFGIKFGGSEDPPYVFYVVRTFRCG